MNRTKFFASIIAIVALALLLVWQRESLAKFKAENESLRRQIEQLSRAQAPAISNSSDNNTLTPEQISELLKLRGEVTQLRGKTNEITSLREQNEKLLASLKEVKPVQTNAVAKKKRPEDALPQDIHPRNSWAFRGYDSPEATAESVCWAMANGDKSAFMAGMSPDQAADIEKHLTSKDFGGEMKSVDIGEFRILDRQASSDDEVVLTMYTTHKNENGDYTGDSENTVFQNIGGQWKITKSGPAK
ncbi:MAG TPA: hypothetical protein VH597_07635 [Verrucomicrobiae bacterium]|nr:hypothetical protein [Verrucomicrobiae bacterium]